MNASLVSFLAWALLMLAMIIGLIVAAKRSRNVDSETERAAEEFLPEIGEIAEKKHYAKYSRPSSVGVSGGWYPQKKKRFTGRTG